MPSTIRFFSRVLRASASAGVSSSLRSSIPPFLPPFALPSASAFSVRLAESLAAISPALGFTPWPGGGAGALPDGVCGFAARFTFALGSGLARGLFATCLGALAFASVLDVPLIAGFFIDRGDAVCAVCFATGVLAGRVLFTARFTGLPVTLFALWAAVAPRCQAGLVRPESITVLAPLALAFAEDFLTGWESFFAMVVLPSLGAILAGVRNHHCKHGDHD